MLDPLFSSDRDQPDVPIWLYSFAHFGKSLWWNGSELFLIFYLTEYLELSGVEAGLVISLGLLVGAAIDLAIATRQTWFSSIPRAGRVQLFGMLGAALGFLLLIGATEMNGVARLATIIGANITYRIAYAFYDLPQNSMLALIEWTPRRRRRAVATRTAAGGASLVLISAVGGMHGIPAVRPGIDGTALLIAASTVLAISSSVALWLRTRTFPDSARLVDACPRLPLRRSLWLMVVVCLTVPAFSKLIPYLTGYGASTVAATPLLVVIGVGTALFQPLWLVIANRRGERAVSTVCGALLTVVALILALGGVGEINLVFCSVLIGIASGGLGTAIWSSFAAAVAGRDALEAAPAFAKLTAVAKVALAAAAIWIGGLLDLIGDRSSATNLQPFFVAVTLLGGLGVLALSLQRRQLPSG